MNRYVRPRIAIGRARCRRQHGRAAHHQRLLQRRHLHRYRRRRSHRHRRKSRLARHHGSHRHLPRRAENHIAIVIRSSDVRRQRDPERGLHVNRLTGVVFRHRGELDLVAHVRLNVRGRDFHRLRLRWRGRRAHFLPANYRRAHQHRDSQPASYALRRDSHAGLPLVPENLGNCRVRT